MPENNGNATGTTATPKPDRRPPRARAAVEFLAKQRRPSELARYEGRKIPWLWQGFLARGKITLLTSQWKAGKTTLLSILAARMEKGGSLAGLPVKPCRVAVITEEDQEDWDLRSLDLHLGEHMSLFCRPYRAKLTKDEWLGTIDALIELKRREGLDVVIIDPLAVFSPGSNENTPAAIMDFLMPLRELSAQGIAVVVSHHPRKGVARAGQAARGSGALPGYADILVEKEWYSEPEEEDRRRRLRAYSRLSETPRHMIIELNEAGDDYVVCEAEDEDKSESTDVIRLILKDAWERMTQREILEQWPEDYPKPNATTISRSLQQGVAKGGILRRGIGRKDDPYQYWLPGKEDDFNPGDDATPEQIERYGARFRERVFGKLNEKYSRPGDEELIARACGKLPETAAASVEEEGASPTGADLPSQVPYPSERSCLSAPSTSGADAAGLADAASNAQVSEKEPDNATTQTVTETEIFAGPDMAAIEPTSDEPPPAGSEEGRKAAPPAIPAPTETGALPVLTAPTERHLPNEKPEPRAKATPPSLALQAGESGDDPDRVKKITEQAGKPSPSPARPPEPTKEEIAEARRRIRRWPYG